MRVPGRRPNAAAAGWTKGRDARTARAARPGPSARSHADRGRGVRRRAFDRRKSRRGGSACCSRERDDDHVRARTPHSPRGGCEGVGAESSGGRACRKPNRGQSRFEPFRCDSAAQPPLRIAVRARHRDRASRRPNADYADYADCSRAGTLPSSTSRDSLVERPRDPWASRGRSQERTKRYSAVRRPRCRRSTPRNPRNPRVVLPLIVAACGLALDRRHTGAPIGEPGAPGRSGSHANP